MTAIKTKLDKWAQKDKDKWICTLKQIKSMKITLVNPLKDYFTSIKEIITMADEFEQFINTGLKSRKPLSFNPKKLQERFYADLFPNNPKGYVSCYGNPDKAIKEFGKKHGQLLCLLYTEYRKYRFYIIQRRYTVLARFNELYLNLVALSAQSLGKRRLLDYDKCYTLIMKALNHDMDRQQLWSMYWRFNPEQDYYKNIILNADLKDFNYLYRYGVFISEYDLRMAQYMQKYPENNLKKLSSYIVKSYQDGFERGLRSYKTKKYVSLILPAGMERLGRLLIKDLQKIGLEAIVACPLTQSLNKQYDYDHRFDMALYYDNSYVEQTLSAYDKSVTALSKLLGLQAGPIYVELFGEEPFAPSDKESALKLSDDQLQLRRIAGSKTSQMFYKHYKQQETSFCIIAFPSPEIGGKFERIFDDTVKLNMLDSMKYAALQQKLIDVLDTAEYVHVKGKGSNETDIKVKLHKLKNPNKETNFENCVADVNIPVGEVFTSPLLKGTNGTLHVKDIYLRNLRFKNLKLTFKDGMISDYSCANFKTKEVNRKYIEENLLMPHKTLPIGEFAIGTNTLAYQMSKKYDIMQLLPILIIEKMGPHFAIGDTCYSREEDFDHFNFVNGKKLIAVENEKSALRKKDPLNAYTQVHTDITLPYEMLQSITAVRPDGSKAYIIKNGLFAVPGTEELNIPLRNIKK